MDHEFSWEHHAKVAAARSIRYIVLYSAWEELYAAEGNAVGRSYLCDP